MVCVHVPNDYLTMDACENDAFFLFLEARTNAEFSEVVKSQQGDAGNV